MSKVNMYFESASPFLRMETGKLLKESQAVRMHTFTAHSLTAVRIGKQSKCPTAGTSERRLAKAFHELLCQH